MQAMDATTVVAMFIGIQSGNRFMDEEEKKGYARWVGLGLIVGVGVGATLEFIGGTFTGIIAAIGGGVGIVIGSIVGHYRAAYHG